MWSLIVFRSPRRQERLLSHSLMVTILVTTMALTVPNRPTLLQRDGLSMEKDVCRLVNNLVLNNHLLNLLKHKIFTCATSVLGEVQIWLCVHCVHSPFHPSATLLGCLVCVIPFLPNFICIMIVYTLNMCTFYFEHIKKWHIS